jgi:hypothetical protein
MTSKRPVRCRSFCADSMSQTARLGRGASTSSPMNDTVPASVKVRLVPSVEMTIESPTL